MGSGSDSVNVHLETPSLSLRVLTVTVADFCFAKI